MVTLVGNAATAVEHRLTAAGVTVARFRLAATSRRWDKAQERWTDGETSFYTVRSWRGLADNVAASVAVGEPLIVQGRLRLREGEQPPEKGGQRWFSAEVDAVAIGHDLTRGTAAFRRVLRALRTGADGPPAPAQQSTPAPEASTGQQSNPAARSSPPPEPPPAQRPTPAPQSAPAPDPSAPPQRHPSQSPLPPSPQPSPPSRPSPPPQQDLWEGALPEERSRTTANAPTEADTSEAAVKAKTAATAPPASRGKSAAKAPSAARARRGARAPAVLKGQTAAKASTVVKTPTTSGIAAVAESSRGSSGPPSAVTHSPETVAVP
ncbi:single-stranded DNA-binding protein [Streptomyces nigrescens]